MGRGRRRNSGLARPNERRMAARKAVQEKREVTAAAAAAAEGGGEEKKAYLSACFGFSLAAALAAI